MARRPRSMGDGFRHWRKCRQPSLARGWRKRYRWIRWPVAYSRPRARAGIRYTQTEPTRRTERSRGSAIDDSRPLRVKGPRVIVKLSLFLEGLDHGQPHLQELRPQRRRRRLLQLVPCGHHGQGPQPPFRGRLEKSPLPEPPRSSAPQLSAGSSELRPAGPVSLLMLDISTIRPEPDSSENVRKLLYEPCLYHAP